MKAMDCKDIQANLSGLLDDALAPELRHLAERHLVSCEPCRKLIDNAERADALLTADVGGWIDESKGLPPGFVEGVLGQTVQVERRDRIAGWITWSGWLAAAASLGLAATVWFVDRSAFVAQTESSEAIAMHDTPADANAFAQRDRATEQIAADAKDDSTDAPATVRTQPRRSIVTASYMPGPEVRPFIADDSLVDTGSMPRPSDVRAEMLTSPLDIARASMSDATREQHNRTGAGDETASARDTDDRAVNAAADSAPALATPQPTIARDDAETLYSASLALDLLRHADDRTFADAERIRRIAESDDLLNRLAIARNRAGVEDRPLLLAAEGVLLRVVRGPLSLEELRELREATARLDLAEQLDTLSQRPMQRDSA